MEIDRAADLIFGVTCGGMLIALYCAIVSWAIRDANQRGKSGCVILLLFWLLGPISVIIWLIIRPKALISRQPQSYLNAEDALSAASKLEMQGDWDAAIAVFEHVGRQWPEHQTYVAACVDEITKKKLQVGA